MMRFTNNGVENRFPGADRTLPEHAAIRPAAVAGAFYPADAHELRSLIDEQLDYARGLLHDTGFAHRLPAGAPKAVIVPHAGYVYSGTTAALAYALLERGRGTIHRAVIIGPTHRVPVRGIACPTASAFATPLGTVSVDRDAEQHALATVPSLSINDATHAREHAVEVQIPFLQRIFGDDLTIVAMNAGDASPREVGDVIRALWGGPETVIVISSDLSHYHPHYEGRELDDETIQRITTRDLPIRPNRACGAYPVNGLLDACLRKGLPVRFLGCSTSGDDGDVALAAEDGVHADRPAMAEPDTPVVGYASFAVWEDATSETGTSSDTDNDAADIATNTVISDQQHSNDSDNSSLPADAGTILINLARTALARYLGVNDPSEPTAADIVAAHAWLHQPGASFVTLREHGNLRGCIGTIEAYRPLGRDVAEHAVDAAVRDPRFMPVSADEFAQLNIEVSVLSKPEPMRVGSRTALEHALRPGVDGLILDDWHGHRATFLPQVWQELPNSHDFVAHLLRKAGLSPRYDWQDGSVECSRYTVHAFEEQS